MISLASQANDLPSWATEPVPSDDNGSQYDDFSDVEDVKTTLLALNRDLLILEEELLFPATTQVAVYLSMNVGEFFRLDAVKLKIDGKLVTGHLYTEREVDALHRGGVQKLYLGNLKTGKHELTAFLLGIGPNKREYKRAATFEFNKSKEAQHLELIIRDSGRKLQPEFTVRDWTRS